MIILTELDFKFSYFEGAAIFDLDVFEWNFSSLHNWNLSEDFLINVLFIIYIKKQSGFKPESYYDNTSKKIIKLINPFYTKLHNYLEEEF